MKIESKDLLLEIQTVLKDELVANITQADGILKLRFVNGQSFALHIEEKE